MGNIKTPGSYRDQSQALLAKKQMTRCQDEDVPPEETGIGRLVSDMGWIWQLYGICYLLEQMHPLSNYKTTEFECCKSVFPDTTSVPRVLKKMGCDFSKNSSQQVPAQNVNK